MGNKNRTKQQVKERRNRKRFEEGKKKIQKMKVAAETAIPASQKDRWSDAGSQEIAISLASAETSQDPDYVAFCVSRTLEAASELDVLWLRTAAALQLGLFSLKDIDRKGILREFDKIAFGLSVQNKDWEHDTGLRYETDKFLCYLVFGGHPRFRELFGYILVPSIRCDLVNDIIPADYNEWVGKESTKMLAKKLVEFDMATVE